MDDPWSIRITSTHAAAGAAREQLGKRPLLVTPSRVHDKARGLIHDEQVLVLPHDLKSGVGGICGRHFRCRLVVLLLAPVPIWSGMG